MRKKLSIAILLLSVPISVLLAATVFSDKSYAYLSLVIVVISLAALFISFEKKENSARQLIVISIMCVLSIVGRLVFAVIPAFKPVTAIIILLSMYFGGEAGFICGAMTALISNFYFGQGPWTPYQMLASGLVGLFAGLLAPLLRRNLIITCVYGALAGVIFSLIMDIQTAMWYTNEFNLAVYVTKIGTSLPFTIIYAISNVIFLLLLAKPIGKKIERLKIKYGI
ncbi:MAG: ECF transporter S component [Clostridia bacterium]|nr:ECF transporter S component [Clostridia bacterium]